MSNEDPILKGVREVYKQNQLILAQLELLSKQLSNSGEQGTTNNIVAGTPNASDTQSAATGKPWDKWTKTKDGQAVPQDVKDTFKL